MRLNWFGCLPPIGGAASLYAARLLPFLKGRADVTVWTTQPHWDRGLERWATVCHWDANLPVWQELNQADATLYHIDTSPVGLSLDAIGEHHPGIAVLHEDSAIHRVKPLGVVVFTAEQFRTLKEWRRWPLLLAPLPWAVNELEGSHALSDYKSHAETLLTFADETRLFCQRLTAEELAHRTAEEMSHWTNAGCASPELERTVRCIVEVTGSAQSARPIRQPRAA
jgi:hypothetical protein